MLFEGGLLICKFTVPANAMGTEQNSIATISHPTVRIVLLIDRVSALALSDGSFPGTKPVVLGRL
jgi:hypothetical protein